MQQHLTLSQLQQRIRFTLEDNIRECWVVAEINEMNVNNSGHCYLMLVEKGGDNHIPKAKISGVIWRSSFTMLNTYFRETTGIPIKAGLKVLIKVSINYHELYGISLLVKEIDPAYTLGDMERQRQECIKKLKEDGVFEMNKELEQSFVIERIAVISSDKAAGYQDFINELTNNEYGYYYNIELFSAFMQGADAENSIIDALYRIADRADEFDTVAIIRGGGSQSDLGCFDSYILCSNIAQFPLPIITGIGHNKDVSIADMVAHDTLKTPTAVARFLIDEKIAFENQLNNLGSIIENRTKDALYNSQEYVGNISREIHSLTKNHIHDSLLSIERKTNELNMYVKQNISIEQNRLKTYSDSIKLATKLIFDNENNKLITDQNSLKSISSSIISLRLLHLETLSSKVDSHDPQRILNMGYSISTVGGKALKFIEDINIGDDIDIRLSNGMIKTKVIDYKSNTGS